VSQVRRRLLLSAALLGPGLVAGAWLAHDVLAVRDDLTHAQSLARVAERQLRSGHAPDLRALQARLDDAARHTHGPLWGAGEHVPGLGGSLQAVDHAARAGALLADRALPEAVAAYDLVNGARLVAGGRVDLALLARVRQHVAAAAAATHQARALLGPEQGVGAVRQRLRPVRTRVRELDEALTTAVGALAQAPAMLGADRPRSYLLAVQNDAEARATGGLVGSVALVTASHGRVALSRSVTDELLHNAPHPVPSDPAAARTWTEQGSTLAWFDANLTPYAPDAARNLAGLWSAQGHPAVDGVVLLDQVSMHDLMSAPVQLPDGTRVTRDGILDFVSHREYVDHPRPAARKALLRDLAGAIFTSATRQATLRTLLDAGRSGHVFLWSAHPAEQLLLAPRLLGGALPATDTAYLQVVTQNLGGNKLDYYLHRTVRVRREGDALRVTVELVNTAPRGLPSYVTVRSDHPSTAVGYGQAKTALSVYGALSSQLSAVTVDGRAAGMRFDLDHGHAFGTLVLELPVGRTVTVSLLLTEPGGELVYRQQPLVRPDVLQIDVGHRILGR
jgi:hypothetical protein